MTTVYPNGTPDVIDHIRTQADTLVRRMNPGCDYSGPWFAPKVTEVAEAGARKICLDLIGQGRADLARKIRLAWDASSAS